jgi:uncharacterized protein (TIGR03435 family)
MLHPIVQGVVETRAGREFAAIGVALLLVGVMLAPQARGQTQPAGVKATQMTVGEKLPEFEVASIRPCPRGGGLFSISPYGTSRFTVTNATMELLISLAFGVSDKQILGAPSWLSSECFDVTAKAEDNVSLTYEQVKPRLQQLLVQRFKLAIHRETKDLQGYALVVAKGGPKLKESTPGAEPQGSILRGAVRNPSASMEHLASMLARPVGHPVVDKTGIKGSYDILLKYAPEGDATSSLPSIFTALQEQLGLKLETRKVPVEMLTIDHIERVPAEN